MATEQLQSEKSIEAEIRYLRHDLDSLRIDITGRNLGDDLLDRRPTRVFDGRAAGNEPTLEAEGFQLAYWPSDAVTNRRSELMDRMTSMKPLETSPVQLAYWAETLPLIQEVSGAREVYALHASGVRYSPATGRQKVMTPAGWAHLDYDAQEAEEQLRQTLERHQRNPAPYSRFVLYQGWRALSPPPQDFPLALCNGNTVSPDDIIPIDYHIQTEERELTYRSSGARYSADHEWWYFPDMSIDEMIVFKGYDSALGEDFKTLHVAIEDRTVDGAVPRISIESRYFALYD